MEKEIFDYVFVVLVYRNYQDLDELIVSISKTIVNYRILVVNSYYDEDSEKKVRFVADKYHCDFINVENRGYSYGNNHGIKYAADHYRFRYLVVSNPDIIIGKFPQNCRELKGDIIAPEIIAASGKHQNPMHIRENRVSEWLIYKGFKKQNNLLILAGIGMNKILREIFLRIRKPTEDSKIKIFAAHGSFVIFSSRAIRKLGTAPYDENIFLFAEESVLGIKAKREGLITTYMPCIRVNHKEDGSMKLGGISVNKELARANIYYYETYRMKKQR
ncbi:MAG: hypothetical protein SOW08_02615 [Lachnospiraceae bacterium]|nr:hypothetical protein [Lachnospiraceae bacterium]